MTQEHGDDPRAHMGLPLSNGKLAMWLFLVTEIMFFTALIGTYMLLRNSTQPIVRTVTDDAGNQKLVKDNWPTPHEVHLVEAIGAGNTFVLIVSSLTVVLAHHYLAQRNVKKATMLIGVTLGLGAVFLLVKAYEYSQKFKHDILPGHIGEALPGMDVQTERKYHGSSLRYVNRVRAQLDHIIEGIVGPLKEKQKGEVDALNKEIAKLKEDKAPPAKVKEAEDRLAALQKKHAEDLANAVEEQPDEKIRDVGRLRDDMRERVEVGKYRRPLSPPEVGQRVNELLKKHEDLHLTPTIPHANMWASCYFIMTGFHAVHVFGGLVVLGIILIMGLRGTLGPQHESMIELTGLYWHFVDIVWIFLFPLLYLV